MMTDNQKSENDSYDNFVDNINTDIDIGGGITSQVLGIDGDDDMLDSHITNSVHTTGFNDSFDGYEPKKLTDDERQDIDYRSIYVGNVDYSSTAKDLEQHFKGCGAINRVTILTDKYSGHPKGHAYIEFESNESIDTALLLDDSTFHGRTIKVLPKRTNIVGISSTNRPPRRGRYSRGRGHGRFYGGGSVHSYRVPRFNRRGGYRFSPY